MATTFTWKKESSPSEILTKIAGIRTVSSDGSSFSSVLEIMEWVAIIESHIVFPRSYEFASRNDLVFKAAAHCKNPLTAESFIEELNRQYSSLASAKETNLEFLSSISMRIREVDLIWKDTRIRWTQIGGDYPSIFKSRSQLITEVSLPFNLTDDLYTKLILTVKAKTGHQAAQIALDALDLNRAFWCLFNNSTMSWGTTTLKPINTIRLGGVHSVHNNDGTLTADSPLWFEPHFCRINSLAQMSEATVANAHKLAGQVEQSRYSEVLQRSLLLYVRALDERDHANSLFKLWAAIEHLTSPNKADYELVVKRCSFFYRNRKYHKQVLEHLRARRNQFIHVGLEGDNTTICCYQLQAYFCKLFMFHAEMHGLFSSLEEANLFLDQSHDLPSLERKLAILTAAKQYITPKPTVAQNVAGL
jgi:hypothetical protein